MGAIKLSLALIITGLTLCSCSDKSLQKYLVEKQTDNKFVKVDIPTSLMDGEKSNLDAEDREILKSIRKINVVAYPIKDDDSKTYISEKEELESILNQEKYKDLTRIKSKEWNATLKYTGEEDAIDEVIIYANADSRGFAIFRLIGDDMKPEHMLRLMKSLENGNLDLSGFGGLKEIFEGEQKDSI